MIIFNSWRQARWQPVQNRLNSLTPAEQRPALWFFAWINSSLQLLRAEHTCLLLNAMCAKIICEQMQTLGWMICVHRSDASVTAARYHLLPHNHKKGRRKKEPPTHVDTLANLRSWRKVLTLLSCLLLCYGAFPMIMWVFGGEGGGGNWCCLALYSSSSP